MKTELQLFSDKVDHYLLRVKGERLAQLAKWKLQSHSPAVWQTILSEEVGELAQQILRQEFNPNGKPFSNEQLVAEAIQVAAVALAIAQCAEDGSA